MRNLSPGANFAWQPHSCDPLQPVLDLGGAEFHFGTGQHALFLHEVDETLNPQLEIGQLIVHVGLQILARTAKFVDAIDLHFRGADGRHQGGKQALPRLGLMTARADRAGGKAAHVVWSSHRFAPGRAAMSPTRRAISSGATNFFPTTSVRCLPPICRNSLAVGILGLHILDGAADLVILPSGSRRAKLHQRGYRFCDGSASCSARSI